MNDMPESTGSQSERERQVNAVIAKYYEAVEQGDRPDPTAFVAAHPEYAAELKEFLADVVLLNEVVRPSASNLAATQIPLIPAAAAAGLVIRYFGEYELLEQLGSGGMGVVYKARQSKLKRIVALKLIKAGELANPQDLQRFQAEAQAAARLSHPGIVPVHEVGVFQGQHFYTMDYVAGANLSQLHRDEPVPSRRAAELIQQLAEAIDYAHQQGVVHRDLKPANILLTAEGTPRITDFGLAKLLRTDDDSQAVTLTETGQILGTAGYMSPEQAGGKTRLVGPAADIYALGAVLYALLTSRAPFVGESVSHTIMQVLHKEPVSPRVLNPGVPRDLETICLKCLEKEPYKRYGTAQLLAEDLGRFLAGRPVEARPISPLGRGWRWCRRNPVVAGLMTTVAASLLLGTAVSLYFADQAQRNANANLQLAMDESSARQLADERKEEADRLADLAETRRKEAEHSAELAERRRQQAEEEARLTKRRLYCADMIAAQQARENGRIAAALSLLNRHLPKEGEADLRSFEWHYLLQRCHGEFLKFDTAGLTHAICSDGTIVATSQRDGTIVLWDAVTGGEVRRLSGHTADLTFLSFSNDGTRLVSVAGDQTLRVWNTVSGLELLKLPDNSKVVRAVEFSPDNRLIAYRNQEEHVIKVWDCTSGKMVAMFPGGIQFAFCPDGRQIASVNTNQVVVWDMELNKTVRQVKLGGTLVIDMQFHENRIKIATSAKEGTVLLWDEAGRLIQTLKGHTSHVIDLAYNPDATQIYTLSADDSVRIWDVSSGVELRRIDLPAKAAEIAVNFDGTRIVSAGKYPRGYDQWMRVWDTWADFDPHDLRHDSPYVFSAEFSPDGSKIAASGGELPPWAALWDVESGRVIRMTGHELPQGKARLAISPNGDQIALATVKYIYLLDMDNMSLGFDVLKATLKIPWNPGQHDYNNGYFAFYPDGNQIAGCMELEGKARAIKTWNSRTGKELLTFNGTAPIAISPDGTQIATQRARGQITIWDSRTGRERRTFLGHSRGIASLKYSLDGRLLGSASGDKTAKVWDPNTGKELQSFSGHLSGVHDVAFTPDGQRLAAAYYDGVVKVWDVETGAQALTLHGTTTGANSLAFNKDGTRLASSHAGGTVKLWEAVPRSPLPGAFSATATLASRRISGPGPGLQSVVHSPSGQYALTGGSDQIVTLWELPTQKKLREYVGHSGKITGVAVSLNGMLVATCSDDKSVRIWDFESAKELHRFDSEDGFSSVGLSRDGQSVFATNMDCKVRIWKLLDGALSLEVAFESPTLDIAECFERGNFVIGTAAGIVCQMRDERVFEFDRSHVHSAQSICVMETRKHKFSLLSGSLDHTIRFRNSWENSGRTYRGHIGGVNAVRPLPDGRRFISGSADRTLRLWNLESGQELARGTTGSVVHGVSVAPDGNSCLTACADGTLLQWDLSSVESHLRSLPKPDPNNAEHQKRLKYTEIPLAKPFTSVFSDLTPEEFQLTFDAAVKRGLRPSKRTISVKDGVVLHSGEFIPSENKRWESRSGQTKVSHEQTHAKLTAEGLVLEWHASVTLNGQEIHAAVWVSK